MLHHWIGDRNSPQASEWQMVLGWCAPCIHDQMWDSHRWHHHSVSPQCHYQIGCKSFLQDWLSVAASATDSVWFVSIPSALWNRVQGWIHRLDHRQYQLVNTTSAGHSGLILWEMDSHPEQWTMSVSEHPICTIKLGHGLTGWTIDDIGQWALHLHDQFGKWTDKLNNRQYWSMSTPFALSIWEMDSHSEQCTASVSEHPICTINLVNGLTSWTTDNVGQWAAHLHYQIGKWTHGLNNRQHRSVSTPSAPLNWEMDSHSEWQTMSVSEHPICTIKLGKGLTGWTIDNIGQWAPHLHYQFGRWTHKLNNRQHWSVSTPSALSIWGIDSHTEKTGNIGQWAPHLHYQIGKWTHTLNDRQCWSVSTPSALSNWEMDSHSEQHTTLVSEHPICTINRLTNWTTDDIDQWAPIQWEMDSQAEWQTMSVSEHPLCTINLGNGLTSWTTHNIGQWVPHLHYQIGQWTHGLNDKQHQSVGTICTIKLENGLTV
jgi:predicted DNA-binding transcriptional regulator AlpA